jgi:intracellular multiplication protein IcmT
MIDIHWRNTQKPARFFFLDARAFMAVLLFLVHARLSTFIIAITIMTMFWMVERRGLSFSAALRAFRRWILRQNESPSGRTKFFEIAVA